jgi:hypothetical protein
MAAGDISSEAVQIFGGRGLTRTGMGRHIEMFRRTQKFDAILWVVLLVPAGRHTGD